MHKLLLLIFIAAGFQSVNAQIFQSNYFLKKLHIHTDTSVIDLQIIEEELKIRTKSHLKYFWYAKRSIYSNQGGIGGYVLHGPYKCFDLNNALVEQGAFKKGLKSGKWIYWDASGNLIKEAMYKKGRLNGKLIEYKNNIVVGKTKYKKDDIYTGLPFISNIFKTNKDSIVPDQDTSQLIDTNKMKEQLEVPEKEEKVKTESKNSENIKETEEPIRTRRRRSSTSQSKVD